MIKSPFFHKRAVSRFTQTGSLPLSSLPPPSNNHLFLSFLDPIIFPSKMPYVLKALTSFMVGIRRASRHVSTTSNHCRKLSTTQIQQRNGSQIPLAYYCSSLSELNQKWTEHLEKHDAGWSKHLQKLDAMWSKRLQDVDSLHLTSTVELETMHFELSQAQWKGIQHLCLQIHDLQVGLPPLAPSGIRVLTFYQDRVTTEGESIEHLKEIVNIRVALHM